MNEGDRERPELSGVGAEVRAYIEALEAEVAQLRPGRRGSALRQSSEIAGDAAEPPTTVNVITISAAGVAKRTARHLYERQHRGGMGVFDLETAGDDAPAVLGMANEGQDVLLFTNQGRAFRVGMSALPQTAVRGRGRPLGEIVPLRAGERVVACLPDSGPARGERGAAVILVSQRGWVRRIRSQYFGSRMIPGTSFHDVKEGGYVVAACWTKGNQELLITTRLGKAIRFAEAQVPARGCLGLRVDPEDEVVGVSAVTGESGVFLVTADGKGTIRLMGGFAANKVPGAGGKMIMKADNVVGAVMVDESDELFIISRLSKMIRFAAAEVPTKEGVVQGVHCMSLRADEAVAGMAG